MAVRYHLPEALFDSREPAGLEPLSFDRRFALPTDEKQRKALLERTREFHAKRLAERRKDGVKVSFDPERVFDGPVPESTEALVDALIGRLLIVPARSLTRSSIIDAIQHVNPQTRVELIARLILTTPEYQLA